MKIQKSNLQLRDLERSNSALSLCIQESKKQLDAGYAYSTYTTAVKQKIDGLIKARDQLMRAMVKIREYRAINHSYCKNEKYDRHFSSDDLSKLFLAGINLSGAIYEFNYTFGTNNNKTIQNKINEFVSLSDVNKVCQKGSATDKELEPLQDQINTLSWNAIDVARSTQQQ